MLEKIKIMLGLDETKDELLKLLVDDAIEEVVNYCNLTTYPEKLNSTVIKMVIQNYNRLGSEGISSQSFSGVSESFIDGYTADIIMVLNKNRKVRFL